MLEGKPILLAFRFRFKMHSRCLKACVRIYSNLTPWQVKFDFWRIFLFTYTLPSVPLEFGIRVALVLVETLVSVLSRLAGEGLLEEVVICGDSEEILMVLGAFGFKSKKNNNN